MEGKKWSVVAAVVVSIGLLSESVLAIPPFARKYQTSCTTCHYAYPKLNGFGRAFKNNGYRYPGDDESLVKEEPVSLGAEAYKKVFPDAIWPSDIPGHVPIGVWLVGQFSYYPHARSLGGTPGADGSPVPALDDPLVVGSALAPSGPKADRHTIADTSFDTPEDVEFLFAGTLAESLSFFGSAAFSNDGTASANFRVGYNPWTYLNVTFGMVDPDFTGNDPDRLTIQPYNVARLATVSDFGLYDHQAGVEVWGAMDGMGGAGGLEYAVGVVNGPPGAYSDNNGNKDIYGRVSYKFFGHPVVGGGKEEATTADPWRDDQVTLTAFAYRGVGNVTFVPDETAGTEEFLLQDTYVELGARLTAAYDRLMVNAAFATLSDKLGRGADDHEYGSYRASAWYVEGNYVVYPWLIPVVRYESANLAQGIAHDENGHKPTDQNIIASVTVLPRANVKLVAEYFRGLNDSRKNVDAAFLQLHVSL